MPESQIKEETDEPEIVTSNDLSIQKLKELYDSINTINVEKKTKKRKAQGSTNSIRKKANIDEPFDISLLNQSDELKGDSAVKTDAESLAPRVFNNAQMTENQPKKKKMYAHYCDFLSIEHILDIPKYYLYVILLSLLCRGHIEIVALDHKVDFFSDFKLNKSTENFLNSMKDDKRRVR